MNTDLYTHVKKYKMSSIKILKIAKKIVKRDKAFFVALAKLEVNPNKIKNEKNQLCI